MAAGGSLLSHGDEEPDQAPGEVVEFGGGALTRDRRTGGGDDTFAGERGRLNRRFVLVRAHP